MRHMGGCISHHIPLSLHDIPGSLQYYTMLIHFAGYKHYSAIPI
jgi:hypothetical protein